MIGHRKNKWTVEEEEALLAGIAKHGYGKWANIADDPEFSNQLIDRTNINLQDKWRNMKNRVGLVVEQSKTQTLKSDSNSISPAKNEPSPKISSDMSNESRYNAMVVEAISTINGKNGSDLSEILSFIEERHEVPQNFKKLLSYSLRLLVSQDKLKKVRNRYRISGTKATTPTLTLHPKDSVKPSELPRTSVISTISKETHDIDAAANKVPELPSTSVISTISKEAQDIDAAANKVPELPSTSVISTISKETQDIDAAANKVAERFNEWAEENNVWYEEQQDFRKFLSECLEFLVSQGKLEKDLNSYKISELENKVLEAAPEVVALKLAESNNKRIIAAEAVEEEQRMLKLVEESQTMLELCLEIHKQCARGEEVFLR